MRATLLSLGLVMFTATSVHAANMISGVGSITSGMNNNGDPNNGGTVLVNTGTILDGLYGSANLGYLVDDYPGSLGWGDNLIIKATAVVNSEGTESTDNNFATLGYFGQSFSTGARGEVAFGVSIAGKNDERIFLLIGGSLVGPVGNWRSTFGDGNPFDINLSASEAGGQLTVTGTISDAGNTININSTSGVNPNETLLAYGTSSTLPSGAGRNFGVDFSDLMYISTVPEPGTLVLLTCALAAIGLRRQRR